MPEWNDEYRRGMVVTAHPDDAEFSSSGTVAKWVAAGWEVVYVICTNGDKGSSDPALTSADLARIRRREQTEAGARLGLKDVVFLDHPDAYLTPSLELRKQLAREIRRHKPDVLITMHPMRNLDGSYGFGHPDHMAAGEAAMAAVFPTARDRLTFPDLLDEGLEPHNVREVWVIGHPDPDLWIDVTDTMERAIEALLCHVSQISDDHDAVADSMRRGRRQRGTGRGMRYAEAFKRISFERWGPGSGRPGDHDDDEDEL